MKSEFVQPRFDGARFAENTLPLEVARDLSAYEALVVELAKHLFLQENPERQRVQKGFGSDFHLHLERLDDGSAKPLLSIVTAGMLALNQGTYTYFERARDLISECIAAAEGTLPVAFPRELLAHFNQIGRSLRPDESMELPLPTGGTTTLTPDRRKHLVLAAGKVYEREFELNGVIAGADWAKSTLRLETAEGSSVYVPMPESFHAQAREFGGRFRHQVTVEGTALYDAWDRLQKVVSVKSMEVQLDYQLSSRFEALMRLENGWLDGAGKAPDKAALAKVAEKLIGQFPETVPLPLVVPTPEGNLLLEWDLPGSPSIDLELPSLVAAYHSFGPDETEVERDFVLTSDDAWGQLFGFMKDNVGEAAA